MLDNARSIVLPPLRRKSDCNLLRLSLEQGSYGRWQDALNQVRLKVEIQLGRGHED